MARTTSRTKEQTRAAVEAATEWLSIAQAAHRLGVSPWTIRRRIADGSLLAHRFGPRLIRIDSDDVDNLGRIVPTVGTISGGDPNAAA